MGELRTSSAPADLDLPVSTQARARVDPEDVGVVPNGVHTHANPYTMGFTGRLSGLRKDMGADRWNLGQRLSRNLSLSSLSDQQDGLLRGRRHRINSADLMDPEFSSCCPHSPLARALKTIEETFLVARLALLLASYLGLGWTWLYKLICLCMYSCLLFPGFLQMILFYFFSYRVIRSVPYGLNPRNRLDLYVPPGHWNMDKGLRPVVIYITGGAWTIGYKAWGSLLGRRLSKQGILVCCLDYRNFPQGTVLEMLEDVNCGISWALRKILYYGGDPDQVVVVGQSCGAHLALLALLTQAEQEASGGRLPGGHPAWSPSRIRGVVGVSGVYNCYDMADHFHSRGLYHSLFDRIMSIQGVPELKLLSPTYCVKGATWGKELPRVLLLHGTHDVCALVSNAVQFKKELQEAGAQVELKMYAGQTHTSPLIENPMRGGCDKLVDDIISFVLGEEVHTRNAALCPAFLINLAALVCPF